MKLAIRSGLCFLMLILLPGCWNAKLIQEMSYITAIGIDFKDGQYYTYGQVLSFSNIAKSEGTQIGKKTPVWVGKGVGKTPTEAMISLYNTSQMPVFWGHVKAVILTENVMKKNITDVFDIMNRYREIRYNIWSFGTDQSIEEVLTVKSILNLAPILTILENPYDSYKQNSRILPVYMFKFIAATKEPGETAYLPSITITKNEWKADEKKSSMLKINGAYFFQGNQYLGKLSDTEMLGIRWLTQRGIRHHLTVPSSENPMATLILLRPRVKIKPTFEGDQVRYQVKVKVSGYVDELLEDAPEPELEAKAAKLIKQQIMETYKYGLGIKADVLELNERLYRKYPRKWNELQQSKKFFLTEDSLQSIDVKVNIKHTGKYKERAE